MKIWHPIVGIIVWKVIYIIVKNMALANEIKYGDTLFMIAYELEGFLIPILLLLTMLLAIRDIIRYIKKHWNKES